METKPKLTAKQMLETYHVNYAEISEPCTLGIHPYVQPGRTPPHAS
jgi:hypothetical protein